MEQPPPSWTIQATAQVAGVVVTLLAVLVALFKEEIVRLWRRPQLAARIRLEPPDCHKTQMTMTDARSRVVLACFDCYYFRLWVENRGRQRADQVQVFAARLLRRHADGVFREEKSFVPMNLRWSHTGEIYAQGISARMGKHCDLAHIVEPAGKRDTGTDLPGVPAEKTVLALDLEVQPATLSHLLAPGVYQLELKVAGANAGSRMKRLEITLTGQWSADEKTMFSDGVGIRELN